MRRGINYSRNRGRAAPANRNYAQRDNYARRALGSLIRELSAALDLAVAGMIVARGRAGMPKRARPGSPDPLPRVRAIMHDRLGIALTPTAAGPASRCAPPPESGRPSARPGCRACAPRPQISLMAV